MDILKTRKPANLFPPKIPAKKNICNKHFPVGHRKCSSQRVSLLKGVPGTTFAPSFSFTGPVALPSFSLASSPALLSSNPLQNIHVGPPRPLSFFLNQPFHFTPRHFLLLLPPLVLRPFAPSFHSRSHPRTRRQCLWWRFRNRRRVGAGSVGNVDGGQSSAHF